MTEEAKIVEAITPKKKKDFSLADSILALAVFVIGYIISAWILFGNGQGLGAFIILLVTSLISIFFIRSKKITVSKKDLIGLGIILVLALPLFISSDAFIKFLVMSFTEISFIYWFFSASGNREDSEINDMLFFDIIKSVFVLPFSCISDIFGAFSNLFKRSSFGKKILLIVGGIALAIIPTTIVTVLLISADEAFLNLTEKLFKDIFTDIPEGILYFLFSIPLSMYVYGMLYAGITHEKKDSMTREKNEKAMSLLRFTPTLLSCAAITPIILVYLLFFFSQTSYFLSAFSGIRPENITFAEYARKGFFELTAVSVINMIIILVAYTFTKRSENKPSRAIRGYVITLSAITLALIAIALSKMFMYIGAYGLSRLRVYTTWFMLLLALVFVIIIIKQISLRFNFARTLAFGFTVMFVALVFCNTDVIVAKYNIHLYESGKFDTVDIDMMYDLSDSVVQYVIPLADDENEHVATKAKHYIEHKKNLLEVKDNSFAKFNLSTHIAKRAIEEYYAKS